ncbi:plastocyanin/azurin family copper-binding protein [Halosegnis marinus]|uniref:Plastocyanin/azurin family copper-binding protein n=1 Tax=Halosegnis marinus TaxID=3034023 RepID=A0ABD5ZQI3_9EURY|nr:plastocyanin/azurin family copper-binding protein [Halosegnis sp. DT85]
MERRAFLGRVAPLGVVALAGCSGGDPTATATDEPTATATATATPAAPDADLVVEVGPGGSLAFDPAEASVDPGATVAWVWRSGGHSVTPDGASGDWQGTGTTLHDAGYVHEHTFEDEGTYDYYCAPHRGAGMVGTLTVGDPATATETATETETPTATEEPTATPEADLVVTVAPDGALRFDPAEFTVSAGETVRWEWDGAGHNVSPERQPSGASWPGRDETTYGSGTTHSYTFEVPGEYAYHCDPHRSVGMTGSFTVE